MRTKEPKKLKTEAEKAHLREYYYAHREVMQAQHKAWMDEHREGEREKRRERYKTTTQAEEREWARARKHVYGRADHLRSKYGLTLDQFDAMFALQEGKCAICQTSIEGKGKAYVDHDHTSGKVRLLLCNRCNRCLGLLGDDPAILRAAADYLEKFGD